MFLTNSHSMGQTCFRTCFVKILSVSKIWLNNNDNNALMIGFIQPLNFSDCPSIYTNDYQFLCRDLPCKYETTIPRTEFARKEPYNNFPFLYSVAMLPPAIHGKHLISALIQINIYCANSTESSQMVGHAESVNTFHITGRLWGLTVKFYKIQIRPWRWKHVNTSSCFRVRFMLQMPHPPSPSTSIPFGDIRNLITPAF